MRLIDADKLIKDVMELWDYKTVDGITATTVLKQTITDIENQPTVKAITVEWIDGYIKRRANDVNIYAEILFISDMVKEWEKENESTRSDI